MNAYEKAADTLLQLSGCKVRRYRTSNSGVAYTRADDWGIEAPQPRGPISFGVFAHEIGHQWLHRNSAKPRWLKEVEAWEYALAQFDKFGLSGVEKCRDRAAHSLTYAAAKTLRRCSPATARAILDRFPEWVWSADSTCAMAAADVEERAREEASAA